jgi:hypothetical protein
MVGLVSNPANAPEKELLILTDVLPRTNISNLRRHWAPSRRPRMDKTYQQKMRTTAIRPPVKPGRVYCFRFKWYQRPRLRRT